MKHFWQTKGRSPSNHEHWVASRRRWWNQCFLCVYSMLGQDLALNGLAQFCFQPPVVKHPRHISSGSGCTTSAKKAALSTCHDGLWRRSRMREDQLGCARRQSGGDMQAEDWNCCDGCLVCSARCCRCIAATTK